MTAVASDAAVPRLRAVHTRTATLGMLTLMAAPVVMIAVALAARQDIGEEIGFFLVVLAALGIGAGLVWRFGTWAKVVGLVLTLAGAFMMFWVVFGLSYPASFGDFIPGVLLPLGVVLSLYGNIGAIARRRTLEGAATRGERRTRGVALAIVALAVVVSAVLGFVGRSTVDSTAAAGAVEIAATNFEFTPGELTVAAGGEVLVSNADGFVHTFTVPELGIDETLLPGSAKLIAVDAEPGAYTIYCKPHSDTSEPEPSEAGMAARLVVE